MPVGGFYIEVDGAENLYLALKGTAGGLKDLAWAHKNIGRLAAEDVRRREPVGSASRKDSGSHAPPGFLRARTSGGGGAKQAYVQASTAPFNYLYLQEFGGTSFWHRGGSGAIRARNRAHKDVASAAFDQGVRGHVVYKLPQAPRGRFIWNVAWRMRREIDEQYVMDIRQIAAKYGLEIDITPGNFEIKPEPAPGGGA